jgi:hypothetical protein
MVRHLFAAFQIHVQEVARLGRVSSKSRHAAVTAGT